MVIRALIVAVLAGCATTGPEADGKPPEPTTVEEEVRRAATVASADDKVVRYNPVACNCPPYEVKLGRRWVRARVEGTRDAGSPAGLLELQAREDLDAERVRQYTVRGDLSTSPEICGQGALYLTLSVDEVVTR